MCELLEENKQLKKDCEEARRIAEHLWDTIHKYRRANENPWTTLSIPTQDLLPWRQEKQ